jgi:hypothetical protein
MVGAAGFEPATPCSRKAFSQRQPLISLAFLLRLTPFVPPFLPPIVTIPFPRLQKKTDAI